MQQVQTNQLMSRAQQLQQQGNIEGARRLYMQVLAIFPSNLRAQSALSSLNLIAQRNVPSQQQLNALSKLFRQRDFAAVLASTTRTSNPNYSPDLLEFDQAYEISRVYG